MSTGLNFLPRVMGENLKNVDSEWPKQPSVSYLLGGKALGVNVGGWCESPGGGRVVGGPRKHGAGEGLWPCERPHSLWVSWSVLPSFLH